MIVVVAALGALLVAIAVFAFLRVRSLNERAAALEAERARLAADGEALRGELAERRSELDELAPFRALADHAPDWIWIVDEHGTLTYSNAAGASLLGHDDLTGRSLEELTYPEDQPTGWSGIVRRRHANGSWRTFDSRSVRSGAGWQGIDRDLGEATAATPRPAEGGVAIVRVPVVDGQRQVVAYELIGESVLTSFAPAELHELGAGRPIWVGLEAGEPPELDRGSAVLLLGPDIEHERAEALAGQGFALALDDFEGAPGLLEHCGIVKVAVAGRADDELSALIAGPAERGLELVATGVATAEEFTRCRVLGFSHFQGEFFARPSGEQGTAAASLQSLRELTSSDLSFEDLERIVAADVGLSIALLRHVNSAFFALPRKIDTVKEALALLGVRAVRRWATVVALSSVDEAPDQLIALALLRGRMCELLGRRVPEEDRDRLFTVGLFSVADALLDASMEEVLETLPFSEEISGALLRREGPLGEMLAIVLTYEQGHLPASGDATELAEAYLAALKWADRAGWWVD